MKKNLLILALAAVSFSAAAQTKPAAPAAAAASVAAPAGYAEQLGATITELMSTGDAAQLQETVNKLERAAAAAPTDWLPRYYQAYGRTLLTFVTKEDGPAKDKYLDQATAALEQARKLGGDESELQVMQAYINQARLMISPMTRFQTYGGPIGEALAKAKGANPANPRPYLLEANSVYFTPKMFGGGPEAAKPLYEAAKARFTAFKPATALAPNWGERQVDGRLKSYEQPAAQAAK
ncbi:hypothetical protein [Hymenobacter persicinus]|uniref:Tetratricopeptide repeat protein n=1 Tax=Hymenobacter persicinus TaxID=2025506 RepID=A0A4Q5L8X3_9BACT|nr:hypothetical protein [Hymenobacter persicinus]RYU75840.1 hypothetical protein EWM57_19435 [Hymenobacter persicinus]